MTKSHEGTKGNEPVARGEMSKVTCGGSHDSSKKGNTTHSLYRMKPESIMVPDKRTMWQPTSGFYLMRMETLRQKA